MSVNIYDDTQGTLTRCDGIAPKRYATVQTGFTINNGNAVCINSNITAASKIFAQIVRNDDTGYVWNTWQVFPRTLTDGEVTLYIRDVNGNFPPNNTYMTINIAIFND